MANSKFRCTYCKKYFPVDMAVKIPAGKFCCTEHVHQYAVEHTDKLLKKGKEIKRKAYNQKKREDKKKIRTRTKWYGLLGRLIQQYVAKVRDAGKPCCTCGTTNPDIEYHGGHFIPQKGSDSRRFYLKNINIQCNACNTYKGGKPVEYEAFMIETYGQEYVTWLKADKNHPNLNVQYPTWQDLEAETAKYRKLIREAGIKPCT